MADLRTVVTAQRPTVRGMALSLVPVSACGDCIAVGRRDSVLLVRNDAAEPVTVTVRVPRDFQGLDVADNVLEVQPGTIFFLALRPGVYARSRGSQDAGRVYVDYSATEGVSRAVIGA